jgi:hypothetical protein
MSCGLFNGYNHELRGVASLDEQEHLAGLSRLPDGFHELVGVSHVAPVDGEDEVSSLDSLFVRRTA